MPRTVLLVALGVLASLKVGGAQQRVDQNVVYGMYSGLALRDPVVPVTQMDTMSKALQAAGVITRVVRIPNGGHVWSKEWAGFPGVVVEWLDQHLKNR